MFTKSKGRGVVSLTEREQQVLNLIWDGLKNREIGDVALLGGKPDPIASHLADIIRFHERVL